MKHNLLSRRLQAAADLVRKDTYLADVGTDHAYVPIALCQSGHVRCAVATDIHEGPVRIARQNVSAHGLCHRISVLHTDGLHGTEALGVRDVLICGMGGDLIMRILDEAPFTKSPEVRLILQPMTHADRLRRYLTAKGFRLVDEVLVEEDRIYTVLCAVYDGQARTLSDAEAILGPRNLQKKTPELYKLAEFIREVYLVRREGKRCAGTATSHEDAIIQFMEELLS